MRRSLLALLLCAVMAAAVSCGKGAVSSVEPSSQPEVGEVSSQEAVQSEETQPSSETPEASQPKAKTTSSKAAKKNSSSKEAAEAPSGKTDDQTVKELLSESVEKNAGEGRCVKCKMNADISIVIGGQTFPMSMSGYTYTSYGSSPVMASETTTSFMGEENTTAQYLSGGTYYAASQGKIYQAPVGGRLDDILEQSDETLDFSDQEFSVLNPVITQRSGGGMSISFTLDQNTQGGIGDALGGLFHGESGMQFTTINVTVDLDQDGAMTRMDIQAQMYMDIDGTSVPCTMNLTMIYEYVGADFKISPPQGMDLQNAETMDIGSLLG